MLKINNLTVTIGNKTLLKDISTHIKPGILTACIGKSGAGKTTLLQTIAGLIKPKDGTIFCANKKIINSKTIGFVFQQFNLFSHMTALDNCIDPLVVNGTPYNHAYKQTVAMLKRLGLEGKELCYPDELSGGQQQRVALARALCLQPSILLLDEPTASLDPENRACLITILEDLARQGLTVIFSTQDMELARRAKEILFLAEGKLIEQAIQPIDVRANPHSAAFLIS